MSDWVSADANDPGHQIYSDTDIIREVTKESCGSDTLNVDDEEDEADEGDVKESVVSHGKLQRCLLKA